MHCISLTISISNAYELIPIYYYYYHLSMINITNNEIILVVWRSRCIIDWLTVPHRVCMQMHTGRLFIFFFHFLSTSGLPFVVLVICLPIRSCVCSAWRNTCVHSLYDDVWTCEIVTPYLCVSCGGQWLCGTSLQTYTARVCKRRCAADLNAYGQFVVSIPNTAVWYYYYYYYSSWYAYIKSN